jgi:hypothetical protein
VVAARSTQPHRTAARRPTGSPHHQSASSRRPSPSVRSHPRELRDLDLHAGASPSATRHGSVGRHDTPTASGAATFLGLHRSRRRCARPSRAARSRSSQRPRPRPSTTNAPGGRPAASTRLRAMTPARRAAEADRRGAHPSTRQAVVAPPRRPRSAASGAAHELERGLCSSRTAHERGRLERIERLSPLAPARSGRATPR